SGTAPAWIDGRGSTGRVIPREESARDRDNLSSHLEAAPRSVADRLGGARERRDAKAPSGQLGFFTSSSISLKKSSSLGFFLGLGASLKCSGTSSSNSASSAESRSITVGARLGRLALVASVSNPARSISECRARSCTTSSSSSLWELRKASGPAGA